MRRKQFEEIMEKLNAIEVRLLNLETSNNVYQFSYTDNDIVGDLCGVTESPQCDHAGAYRITPGDYCPGCGITLPVVQIGDATIRGAAIGGASNAY